MDHMQADNEGVKKQIFSKKNKVASAKKRSALTVRPGSVVVRRRQACCLESLITAGGVQMEEAPDATERLRDVMFQAVRTAGKIYGIPVSR